MFNKLLEAVTIEKVDTFTSPCFTRHIYGEFVYLEDTQDMLNIYKNVKLIHTFSISDVHNMYFHKNFIHKYDAKNYTKYHVTEKDLTVCTKQPYKYKNVLFFDDFEVRRGYKHLVRNEKQIYTLPNNLTGVYAIANKEMLGVMCTNQTMLYDVNQNTLRPLVITQSPCTAFDYAPEIYKIVTLESDDILRVWDERYLNHPLHCHHHVTRLHGFINNNICYSGTTQKITLEGAVLHECQGLYNVHVSEPSIYVIEYNAATRLRTTYHYNLYLQI